MKNGAATNLLSLHGEKGRSGCLDVIIDTGKWINHDTQDADEEEKMESSQQGTLISTINFQDTT